MKDGKNKLDVRVVSDAVFDFMSASFTERSLLHGAESSIQDTILNGKSISDGIQILVSNFEFRKLHDLLIRE